MKERLMRGNLFKLFPPHEPPSHARSSPTVRIRIRSIVVVNVIDRTVPMHFIMGKKIPAKSDSDETKIA